MSLNVDFKLSFSALKTYEDSHHLGGGGIFPKLTRYQTSASQGQTQVMSRSQVFKVLYVIQVEQLS